MLGWLGVLLFVICYLLFVPIIRVVRALHVVAGRKFVSLPGCCGTRCAQTVLAKNARKTDKLKRSLNGHNMKHPDDPTFVP